MLKIAQVKDCHELNKVALVSAIRDKGREGCPMKVHVENKPFLTLEEAAAYFNIGTNKLREIALDDSLDCVLYVGSKRLYKRQRLESYLIEAYSI